MKSTSLLLVALAFCAVQAQGPSMVGHSARYRTATPRVASSTTEALPSDSLDCRLVGSLHILGARHVVASGNFAYVAAGWQGFRVVDISDKSNPAVVGSLYIPGPDTFVYNVAKSGNYVYLFTGKIIVVDVSDPTDPIVVRSVNTTGFDYGMAVVGNRGYVSHWSNDFAVLDLSDPSNPDWLGECVTPYFANWVDAAGDYAYASLYDSGMCVIDVSDSSNPVVVGRYDSIEAGKSERIAVDGNYVYLNESARLVILDVSNPSSPTKVGFYQAQNYTLSISKVGDYAYIGCGAGGLRVLDVSDPTDPTSVGYYREESGIKYVVSTGGYIYTTDSESTLQIIEFYGGGSGVEEGRRPPAYGSQLTATIVRGVLWLPAAASSEPQAPSWLLDVSGTRAMRLRHGPNDVRHLSPGVYFVSSPKSVERLVLTR